MAQAEAEADAALGLEDKGAVVVTAAEGWHPGVVGLVAARLKEKFGRPAFAIALEPGRDHLSTRDRGLTIQDVVEKCVCRWIVR